MSAGQPERDDSQVVLLPMEALGDPLLSGVEFRMLAVLYSCCDLYQSECWPSIKELGGKMRFSDETKVCSVTRALEIKGWIDKRSKRSFHGTKIYKLRVPLRLRGRS